MSDISDVASELIFAVPLERLREFEEEQREQASMRRNPYNVMRRKTKALAAFLNVDEATAEAILLGRIDANISES